MVSLATLSPSDRRQIQEVYELAQALFQSELQAMYLYGSAALGGLHPQSDIDLLLVLRGALSEEARNQLTRALLACSGRVGDTCRRPLEVTVVAISEICPWHFPPRCEYLYGEWLRQEIEAGQYPQAHENPDLVILLWQARQHSAALHGPQAKALLPEFSFEEIQKALVASLPDLMENLKGDERNVLLTLSRMWYTLVTHGITSKDHSALWALDRLPASYAPLLQLAKEGYLGAADDHWTERSAETQDLADYMRRQIEALLNKKTETNLF